MIKAFFEDTEIFLTGGSGVVGKALVEKLLRSCNVRRIFIMLRPKRGVAIEKRLVAIKEHKIFRRLIAEKPDELDKLVAVAGDVVLPNLGISVEAAQLMRNVSLVYHCAATVRFDEPIKDAVLLNVGGTLEALKFAESLKQLKLFMHVSTYYSNPYLSYVEPKVYPPPMSWKFVLDLVKRDFMGDTLDWLTKKIITGFPNTYTFTKNLAESLVNEYCPRLPVAIFRPSIVLFSTAEPEPGFPSDMMGVTGLYALIAAGLLKTVYASHKTRLDFTPQDLLVKSLAYYTMHAVEIYEEKTAKVNAVPVYMTSAAKRFPRRLVETLEIAEQLNMWQTAALEKCFLIPGCRTTGNPWLYKFLVLTKQVLPAYLGDLLIQLLGHKPVLMRIVRKGYITMGEMQPFTFNNYDSEGYTLEDDLFNHTMNTNFDVSECLTQVSNLGHLGSIMVQMVFKLREVLLNEDPATIKKQQRIMSIKIFAYNLVRLALAFFTLRWLYRALFVASVTREGVFLKLH